MAALEKRRHSREKKAKGGDKESKKEVELIDLIMPHLDQGKPALTVELSDDDRHIVKDFFLLSSKRTIYACNVSEDELAGATADPDSHPQVARVRKFAAEHSGAEAVVISARIEEELSEMPVEEADEFLKEMGVTAQ
jgi:ribosome-binding ATPase YchF (GTP1/OBG family)